MAILTRLTLTDYIALAQVLVSGALIVAILLQKQGTDIGGIFGGRQENYYNRRGIERSLFFGTIGLTVLFLGLGMANLVL